MTGFFSSYLGSVLALGICTFVCNFACSSEKNEIKNAVAFISGMCMLITVFLPFCHGMSELLKEYTSAKEENYAQAENAENNSLYKLTAKELENNVKSLIFSEIGINTLGLSIELSENDGTINVSKLSVTLNKENEDKQDEIIKLLKDSGFENISIKVEEQNHD